MRSKKIILRRIAAFITSFVFLFSVTSYQYITAEEYAETEEIQPADVTEEVTEPAEETEDTVSETEAEVKEEESSENDTSVPERQSIKINISVNGTSPVKPYNIVRALFHQVIVTDYSDCSASAEIPYGKDISELLWKQESYDNGERVFFNIGQVRYALDDISMTGGGAQICLTEYYDLSSVSLREIMIKPYDLNNRTDKYYPYGTKMALFPSNGWVIDGESEFELHGELLPYISSSGNRDILVIENGKEKLNVPVHRSRFSLSCPNDSGVSMSIKEQDINLYSGLWLDNSSIEADFYVNEGENFKITGVNLVNSGSGEKYPMEITGDGKNVSAHINSKLLNEVSCDNEKYSFDFETIDDYLYIETFIINENKEESYENQKIRTIFEDNNLFCEIQPLLFEQGIAKYIIDSYEIDGERININSKELYENGELIKTLNIPYIHNISILYSKIKYDETSILTVNSSCLENKDNLFSMKPVISSDLLKYEMLNVNQYLTVYDELYSDNSIKSNKTFYGNNFRYLYPYDVESPLETLCVKSILYYENNEFHNMLQEPLYFYFDDYAPKINITNTGDDKLDNTQWSKLIYKFILRTDDREPFPEKDGAGDDVNEIYRNINGAGSEITKITVGGNVFEKKDGEWECVSSNPDQPFTVGIRQISDSEYEVNIALNVSGNIRGLDRTIEVTASDSCGNTSQPESFELRIDKEKPVLTEMKIRNAVHYTDPVFGKTAAPVSDNASDTFFIDMNASDDFSGLETIQVVYGDSDRTYTPEMLQKMKNSNYRKEGDYYSFSIPVLYDSCCRSGLKVILTDKAKNRSVFYYCDDEAPASEEIYGTMVIIDRSSPSASVGSDIFPEHESADGRKWYRRIPEFSVTASDDIEKVNSGIRYLVFSVNGTEKKTGDIYAEKYDVLKIAAEHSSTDPDKADIFYTDGTDRIKITSVDLKDTDGLVRIEVTAVDAAGNSSPAASAEIYADPDKPHSDTHFTIENENDNTRTFGTFLNHGTRIRVKVTEPEKSPSSGLKEALLYYAGKKYSCSFDSEKSASAEFSIPFDSSAENAVSGSLKITVKDNAGNSFTSEELLSSADSELLVFEDVPPEIKDVITDSVVKYTDAENNKWYSSDAEINFKVSDSEKYDIFSGLKAVQIDINGKNIISEDYRKRKEITPDDRFIFSTSDASEHDGRFDVSVMTSDNAGNPAEYKKTLFIDRTAPEITGMSIEGVGSVPLSILNGVYALPYGYFFRESCKVTVYAEDRNASSGMADIVLGLYSFDGTRISEEKVSASQLRYDNGIYSADFTVPEGFRGYIVTEASDNTENRSELYTPQGFITESGSRHSETSSVSVVLPETHFTDRNGHPLYSSDVTASIGAADRFSGISTVEWNMSEYGDSVWKRISADSDGKISGDNAERFRVSGTDNNLVVSAEGSVISSADRNASQIRMKMTDNAGNSSDDMKSFSIDKTAPEISVAYDEAEADSASGIFRTPRTAVITVRERNFDQDRINVTADGNSGSAVYGDWTLVSGTAGSDSAVYRIPVTFRGDGDYILNVEGTDMCDNRADGYTSEKFTVDTSAPVLEIIPSGAEKVNGSYYAGERTLTVRITEHNFDASRIHISGTLNGSEEKFPDSWSFSSDGDVHTAVIRFSENADYTFNIEGDDMAGNRMESYSESFCIDSAAPEIIFDGVKNKSANSGDVNLKVLINDENITTDRISVNIKGANRGDVTAGSGTLERTEEGFAYVFSEFAAEKEIDDIYTVTVSAEDMSGNGSQESLVFSVNRFGSTYVFSDETLAIADTYINNPSDIVLHEINADMLYAESTEVKIIKDSEARTLERGRDYEVHRSGGDGSWYDYLYVISASNFEDDGAYQVIVCSKDEAGNMNANSIDGKTSVLKFGVDRTPPRCTPVNVEKNGAYRTEELEAEFFCEDNIFLESLNVFLDDENINDRIDVSEGRCRFYLQSSSRSCDIRIEMSDIAGNRSDMLIDNILVSTSIIRVIAHRPAVQNGFKISMSAAAAGTVGAVIIHRKRRRETEQF